MDCTACRLRLGDFVSDNLTVAEVEQVRTHCHGCPECTRELSGFQKLVGVLETFPEAEAPRRAPRFGFVVGLAAGVVIALGLLAVSKGENHDVTTFPGTQYANGRLEKGALHCAGHGAGFRITTPAGDVEVVGTEFRMELIEEKDMKSWKAAGAGLILGVAVTSGVVRITNTHGSVTVTGGQEAVSTATSVPRLVGDIESLRKERDSLKQAAAPSTSPEQAEKIKQLRRRVAELEPASPKVRTLAEKLAAAKEIFESALAIDFQGPDVMNQMKTLLARLDELDEDVTAYFVQQFRESPKDAGPRQEIAFGLALRAGGQAATNLLKEWLADRSFPQNERRTMLLTLGNRTSSLFLKKLTVDAELASVAQGMAQSEEASERIGAAGILGWREGGESRTVLSTLASRDADAGVRHAAIQALGFSGDRTTLAFLKSLPPDSAVEGAIAEILRRFPE